MQGEPLSLTYRAKISKINKKKGSSMTTTLRSDVSRQKVLDDWSGRRSFSMFPFNVKHLVVLTDLSKESDHAVDYAVSLAQYFQARLTLLCVSAPLTVRDSYYGLSSINV